MPGGITPLELTIIYGELSVHLREKLAWLELNFKKLSLVATLTQTLVGLVAKVCIGKVYR